ncbi:nucleotide-binding universal stress UspA family protein [Streptomyces sp. 846.5]|nr:universal stress protein [Streptomyces sp. 846.5]TDT97369.1 nucleotide-binding universal stress UspA family protein [Streptomyces sp. 846.5]
MISCVVAAVDGSPSALHALDWAADEAARRGVRLLVVHASLQERYEQNVEDDEDDPASERFLVRRLMAVAVQRARTRQPHVALEAEVIPEETVPALLGLRRLAPLLVLGTRGHGGFPGLLLGSLSLRVAGRATYPVVVVRGAVQGREHRHGRIVLGCGPGDYGTQAVAFAAEEAELWQAELELVRAWQAVPDKPGFPAVARGRADAERAREQVDAVALPPAQAATVKVLRHAIQGGPGAVLLHAAGHADLVVLAARRRFRPFGLELGATTLAMLHHAPCPVAILPNQ